MSRYRSHIRAAAIIIPTAIVFTSATASAAGQQISVERPPGQIVLSDLSVGTGEKLQLTVTDTRADDPGWTVSVSASSGEVTPTLGWKPSVEQYTPAFTDADGTTYAQEVDPGPSIVTKGQSGIEGAVLGSAPRGHGLGIAVLDANLTAVGLVADHAPTVTVTVV